MDNACTTRGLSTCHTANGVHTNMYSNDLSKPCTMVYTKFQCMELANGYTNKIDREALLRMSVNT